MDKALKDFDAEWKTGDRKKAARLAAEYVDAHLIDMTGKYAFMGIPELVPLVDKARAEKDEATRIEIDMWLLAKHPPQNITGSRKG